MSGTSAGAKKAALKNKNRYGDDFYSNLGKKGGSAGRGKDYKGGFAYVAPGQTESNGKRFASLGGYFSKRARKIEKGGKLHTDEINEILTLGVRVLGTMRMNGMIDVATEHYNHITLYTKMGDGDWEYIFNDCGVGPRIRVVWAGVLSTEIENYRQLVRQRSSEGAEELLTENESNRYRIIRNLTKAFEVATGFEVI